MIRRALRILVLGMTLVPRLSASVLAYFAYTRFFRYQPAVDKIYEKIPFEERHLPASVRRVLAKTGTDSRRTYFVSVCLLSQVAPAHVRMGEWHLRNAVWCWLLPRRFDPEQRLVLFSHFLPLEGGSSLTYGARKYFGKTLSQLSEDETLQLLVVSYSPSVYSPSQHPDRFRERLKLITDRYRTAGYSRGAPE
jgi:hypothetical protein